jgi:hypothetical protein
MALFDLRDAVWAVIGPPWPTEVRDEEGADGRRVLTGIR